MTDSVEQLDRYELLTTYAWHLPETCERFWDDLPKTPAEWATSPENCACGFYQQLHAARTMT